jgi:lipopolysaccharide transport system permease protein
MSFNHPTSPKAIFRSLLNHRGLIWELAKRDFVGRYKGSFMGMVWSLINPLFMLSVYTIVFSVVFKARWGTGDESKVSFAIVLFAGMIVHGLFAECLNRAPGLVLAQPNYVKKVVFPLEIFPWVALSSALLHFIVSFTLLLIFCIVSGIGLYATTLLIPLVIAPLLLMTLGLSWFFASLGVYLRDVSQIMGFATTVLLFLSPVFYKVSALPKNYQILLELNPLTLPIEQLRDVMLWGKGIDWISWGISLLISSAIFHIGFWWFQKTRKGFADVI